MLILNRLLLILTVSYAFRSTLDTIAMFMLGMFIAEIFLPFLMVWPLLTAILWLLPWPAAVWFGIGGVFYVAMELLTLEGIQPWPFSELRLHGLKGTHRKGDFNEYVIVVLIIFTILLVSFRDGSQIKQFHPYLYQWEQLYQQGLIDGKEWRDNRSNVF
jgi:hypothetical protein